MKISATELLTSVKDRTARSESVINVFWHRIDTNREDYQKELSELTGELPIVPIVLREDLFHNPNAILSDLASLISRHKRLFERRFKWGSDGRKMAIIILARTELSIHQAASPIQLPEWFPINGGESVPMYIEDITWTAEAPINSPELRLDELCQLLYELDKAIAQRLLFVYGHDHNAGNPLLELLRKIVQDDLNFHEFLSSALRFNESIENTTAFRPSIKEKRSLISQIWATMYGCGPDQLQKPARAFETALELKGEDIRNFHISFVTVLNRPSRRDDGKGIIFIKNMLLAIFSSCQYITAAAHADSYEKYPLGLIKTLSYDLRLALSETLGTLRALPH